MAKQRENKNKSIITAAVVILLVAVSAVLELTGGWDKINSNLGDGVNGNDNPTTTMPAITGYEQATIKFIDVGQGDSTLIISNGESMLIDSGEAEFSDTVIQTMTACGIETLDYLVATHAHSDHMGGFADILDSFSVETIILSEPCSSSESNYVYTNFLKSADKSEAEIEFVVAGDSLTVGTVQCEILAPFEVSGNENNNSIVMKLRVGNTSFLLTGDAESEVENQILESFDNIQADILKVGHHGSKTSTSEDFLSSVSPSIAVILVGKDNTYGHPTKPVLDRLNNYASQILTTETNGTITFYCTATDFSVETEK